MVSAPEACSYDAEADFFQSFPFLEFEKELSYKGLKLFGLGYSNLYKFEDFAVGAVSLLVVEDEPNKL